VIRNRHPYGALDQLQLLLQIREALEQLNIRQSSDGALVTLPERPDFPQDGWPDGRRRKPLGIRDLGHLLVTGTASFELIPNDALQPRRKPVQGKGLIRRHVFCS
jgi:hypothetical protein